MPRSNRKKPATMRDVARYADVSVKTVSNVINDWPYVSDETREKVRAGIREVNYRPNLAARSLVTGKTHSVGVIVPDISNPFFGPAIRGCEEMLLESDYSLLLCDSDEDAGRERYYLNVLMSRGVDALIVWGTRHSASKLQRLVGERTPLLTIELSEAPVSAYHFNIDIDNIAGGRIATAHLLGQGYTRIAHLAGPTDRITAQRRLEGYRQGLAEAGRPYRPELVAACAPTVRGGYELAQALLLEKKPEAIFCYNDLIAIGVLLACRQLGLRVPEDVGLVGFDDIQDASLVDPPLTTVRIAQFELGRLTGELVLNAIRDGVASQHSRTFPVELQVRASSGKDLLTEAGKRAMVECLVATLGADHPANSLPR